MQRSHIHVVHVRNTGSFVFSSRSNHGVLEWPLVKVAALARKCVTIQDNHHHIERPLDAGPKFQHIRCRTHYASRRFRPGSTLARTVYTGRHLILAAPNCPVLDAWAKLERQTARVLLGAYLRPRIRRRALRAPSLDPRTFPNVALRAVRLPLVELGIIVRILKSEILALYPSKFRSTLY